MNEWEDIILKNDIEMAEQICEASDDPVIMDLASRISSDLQRLREE